MTVSSLFLSCGVVATIIFLLRVIAPLDSGSEISGDFTDVSDMDSSFNFFTFESICAFFMCAGWIGWFANVFLKIAIKPTIIISLITGFIATLFYAWLISKIKKLEYVPKSDYNELLNKTGKSYLRFAPKGLGKIEIEYNSKLEILDATNNTDVEIKSFEPIKVVEVKDGIIYIEKA